MAIFNFIFGGFVDKFGFSILKFLLSKINGERDCQMYGFHALHMALSRFLAKIQKYFLFTWPICA